MDVTMWFDPGCPWSWITSRWLVEVSGARHLVLAWRPFSLTLNEAQGRAVDEEVLHHGAHAGLRVLEAARVEHGEEGVGRLYTALGTRIHHEGDSRLDGLTAALRAAGFDPGLAGAATDDRYDEAIHTSMAEAHEGAGEDVGTPLVRFGGAELPIFFGPILSPAPTGQAAGELFDGLHAAAAAGAHGLFELKRDRDGGPQLPRRPAP